MLKRLINRLLDQSLRSKNYEILIIDDGSSDQTSEKIKEVIKDKPNIKYFKRCHSGPSGARNFGIEQATGEIIAFTDDDCLPERNWLEVMESEFAREPKVAGLEGYTYTENENTTPLTHQVTNHSGGVFFPTCNIAYRASWLKEEGGFDILFPFPHNEDVDLGWRMSNYGRIKFVRKMMVYHPPRKEKFYKLVNRLKVLGSEFYLFHKHTGRYKRQRALNPWLNIYLRYILKFQLRDTVIRLVKLQNPIIIGQSIALTCAKVMYLMCLIPFFIRIDRESKNHCERIRLSNQ
jgi:glycosyltransferase involved in cell wall biosynthesis